MSTIHSHGDTAITLTCESIVCDMPCNDNELIARGCDDLHETAAALYIRGANVNI